MKISTKRAIEGYGNSEIIADRVGSDACCPTVIPTRVGFVTARSPAFVEKSASPSSVSPH
ncbi:MAG: hypothetical protein SVX43_19570 [Cyanobacteriota bacterium]|nr:hypothetical protein [Cyanobacteriota bacterium]